MREAGEIARKPLPEMDGLLKLVVEASLSPMAILDRELRYVAASASWRKITGLADDLVGRSHHELIPDQPPHWRAMHSRCLAGATESVNEESFVRSDGTTMWLSGRCEPWRTASGAIGGVLLQCEVITKRKETEAALTRTMAELDRARLLGLERRINEIELVVRLDGTIVHVNDQAIAAYGYSRQELEGLNVRRLRQEDPPAFVAAQMAVAAREGIRFEAVHLRKDGSRFPVEVSSRAFDAGGERYLHSLVRDLTEQHRAHAIVREAEERLERVLEASQDGFFDLDLSTGIATRSDRVARMLGLEPSEIPPTLAGFLTLLHAEDRAPFTAEVAAVVGGTLVSLTRDVRARHADGSSIWIRVRARLTGPEGNRRFSGTVTDVTCERRATARAELLAREQQALLQTATVGISRVVDRKQIWVNPQMVEILGYPIEEQVGVSTRKLYPSEEAWADLGRRAYTAVAAGLSFRTEQELIRKDGRHIWVRYNGKAVDPDDLSKGTIWVLEDITTERAERQRLVEAEARLQGYFDAPVVGLAVTEQDAGFVDVNPAFCHLLGYTREELLSRDWSSLTAPEDQGARLEARRRLLAGEASACTFEKRYLHKDGSVVWANVSVCLVESGPTGRPRFAAMVQDATEQVRARDALRASEAHLQSLVGAMAEGVLVQDASGRITDCNAAAERILGLSRAQLEGLTSIDPRWKAIHADGSPFPGEVHPAMVTLRTGEPCSHVVMGVDAPGQGRRWISVSSEPLRAGPGLKPHAVVITFADITDLRSGQLALAASEARYRSLFEHLREDVTVYEIERGPDGRVTDWILRASNAQARRFFGDAYEAALGRRMTELLGADSMRTYIDRTDRILAGEVVTHELYFPPSGRHYLSTAFPIDDRTIITAALDITDRVHAEAALKQSLAANERMVAELRDALEHVHTLKGLLPICMHCHKIRDDQGYWARLEKYIGDRTGASFSHSLCPECEAKYYPEP